MEKKFSILIANYNNEHYLDQCLESIENQTYSNIEIVIVDDNSSDRSVELINKFILKTQKKVVFIKNDSNMGCGYTKARCVELSSGDICGFLDADDALVSNAVEQMVLYHEQNDDCSLISSRYYICNKKLKIQYSSRIVNSLNFTNYLKCPRLTHFNTFKRSYYFQSDGIRKDITHGVDQDLCLKMEEVGHILFVPEVLYLYRTYSKSVSHGKGGQLATFYNFIIRIDACKRRGIPEKELQNVYSFVVPQYGFFLSKIALMLHKVLYFFNKKNNTFDVYKI